ncbi:MAG: hypothetical protein ACW986_11945 [Promethearchaeota archaeon]|jgi:hypothetical protein
MSFFNPEKEKQRLEELKVRLQLNPLYFREVAALKLQKDLNVY